MQRTAAVLMTGETGAAPPPGVAPDAYADALTEDAYEVAAGLERCGAAVAVWSPDPDRAALLEARAAGVTWPGTPVLRLGGPSPLGSVLAELHRRGAELAAVLAADAPDFPPLLMAKLFRALGRAEAAASPADGGGLAAFAARLPAPAWTSGVELDTPDAVDALTAARPARPALALVPGWHRLRTPADTARLDPGLEGWECTRALLEDPSGLPR
ncbi:hypothetical protein [Nocardiopsis composta]|uniref:MobA-like NTP transferase domain-containing protein n=1 Tax=Nocardiopsis composta TaxID=157465 RepID=A0A7W8QQW2_9ACTN|nr:hypothetical protein [Nocardiopsis composta]MBB5434824.1 hypothetical protein [Nocardiopsis composta]